MVSEQFVFVLGWASWGSIIAGVITAIAVSVVMACLGVALGFTVVNPRSDDPVAGLGITFGVWSFISVLVSMACGGFVSGLFAGRWGLEHGLLVWASTLLLGTLFSGVAMFSAVQALGSALRGLGGGLAGAASSIGKHSVNIAAEAVNELRDKVQINVDVAKLQDTLASVLRDTGVDVLQPEYLQQQLRETRNDLRGVFRRLASNPGEADRTITEFLDKAKERLGRVKDGIDKDAAVTALMNTRNIPQDEAEDLVTVALQGYEQAIHKAREMLAEVREDVEEGRKYLKELADQAREKADRMASAAAKAALGAAVALLIAAAVTMAAGVGGVECASSWYSFSGALVG